MTVLILGLLDILAGLLLAFPVFRRVVLAVGIILLLKGVFSYAFSVMNENWFDWMGGIDILVGVFLLIGIYSPYLAILPISKGIYSLILWFFR